MHTGVDARLLRTFGTTVRVRRIALDLSQAAVAERAGFHRSYVTSVERGERNVALLTLVRLAAALETDASELVANLSR